MKLKINIKQTFYGNINYFMKGYRNENCSLDSVPLQAKGVDAFCYLLQESRLLPVSFNKLYTRSPYIVRVSQTFSTYIKYIYDYLFYIEIHNYEKLHHATFRSKTPYITHIYQSHHPLSIIRDIYVSFIIYNIVSQFSTLPFVFLLNSYSRKHGLDVPFLQQSQ